MKIYVRTITGVIEEFNDKLSLVRFLNDYIHQCGVYNSDEFKSVKWFINRLQKEDLQNISLKEIHQYCFTKIGFEFVDKKAHLQFLDSCIQYYKNQINMKEGN